MYRTIIRTRYRVSDDPAEWGLLGLFVWGYCAANLALRHRARFGAAAIMDGYFRAKDGPAGAALGGKPALEDANSPLTIARSLRPGTAPIQEPRTPVAAKCAASTPPKTAKRQPRRPCQLVNSGLGAFQFRRVIATPSNIGGHTPHQPGPTATHDVVAGGYRRPLPAGHGDQAVSAFVGRFRLGLSFGFGDGQIDYEAKRLGDVCGCGHNLRRPHDRRDGDENALYILERDPDIGRSPRIQHIRHWGRANRDQRGEAGEHVLARRQRAAFDGYRSHLGEGGEDGGFFGHLACPYRSGTARSATTVVAG